MTLQRYLGLSARGLLVVGVLALGWAGLRGVTGCAEEENPMDFDAGGGQGDACSTASDCGLGFLCAGDGTCQRAGAPGTRNAGDGCAYNTDCIIDLVCASYGKCVQPGKGAAGESCLGNEACQKGLLCSATKVCATPGDPGTTVKGEACEEAGDCAFGLVCVDGLDGAGTKTCTALSYWEGLTCLEDDAGAARVYFEVPRPGKKVAEFYRLPFPNDIRIKNGRVDVADHPNPSLALPAEYGDVVGSYLKAIGEDVPAFGPNTTVFLRVSKVFNLNTIKLDFLDIDKSSPGYGKGVGYSMWATTARGKYICQNYIAVRPQIGQPLAFQTTHAVLLRKGILDTEGNEVGQDADFKVMLQQGAPADAALAAAWKAYQPLRDYLADQAIDPSTVIGAAVYTTMDPRARMRRFRDVIRTQAQTPSAKDLTLCDGKVVSPCDDGSDADHVCGSPVAGFDELQGTYATPVFQTGTPPYRTVTDGGGISYDSSGAPLIQRHEKACYALTVPKGATMPPDGWPVVIFAHGTGGSYRSFIENGTAARLAHVQDATGTVSRMAVIGIDGSMHGPRRGSTDDPDRLFFNLQNPKAARDNTYQGAADKLQLVRLLKQIDMDAATSPTGAPLKLDLSRIYFFGHSQGTIEGLPFLAVEPEVKGAVLSGAGGYLIGSLLGKTKPVNISGLVKLVLADSQLGTSHPLLNLLQLYFEEVDGINYGRAMFAKTESGVEPKHTLLTYGVADSYTPPGTIDALGWSMQIRQVNQEAQRCGDTVCNGTESCKTCGTDCGACPAGTTCGDSTCDKAEKTACVCPEDCGPCVYYALDDPPVTENMNIAGSKYTCGMVQYVSDGTYDDHLVALKNPDAIQQTTHFLGSAAASGSPTILKVK